MMCAGSWHYHSLVVLLMGLSSALGTPTKAITAQPRPRSPTTTTHPPTPKHHPTNPHPNTARSRRFDKRIYIPLPEAPARSHMFKVHLGDTPNSLTEKDFGDLGQLTAGFSGSDVSVVVKDVLMQPIRLLREATHFKKVGVGGIVGVV